MMQVVDLSLKQIFRGGERHLEIVDRQKLLITEKKKNKNSKHVVSLLALSPDTERVFRASWNLLFAGIILPSIFIVVEYFTLDAIDSDHSWLRLLLIAGAIATAALCFTAFVASISRKYIFRSRHANIPVVEISVAKPDKEQSQAFAEQIQRCITEVQDARKLSPNDQLAGEMRMLRRLESEGMLNKEYYEQAKMHLLGMFGDKPQPSLQES